MADVTTIRQWIRCICGYARGRAVGPREDCPECGWAPGTHRPPVKVMHLDIGPCARYQDPRPVARLTTGLVHVACLRAPVTTGEMTP